MVPSWPWAPRSHRLAAGGTSLDEALIRALDSQARPVPQLLGVDTAEAYPAGGDGYQLLDRRDDVRAFGVCRRERGGVRLAQARRRLRALRG